MFKIFYWSIVDLLLFSRSFVSDSLDSMDCSTPSFPVLHYLPEFAQTHVHCRWGHPTISFSVTPFSPLTLNLSSIRVFSNESALHIRWPKYWSFSFSISPSNEYSGLIPFRIDWLISLKSKWLSRVFSSTVVQNHQFFSVQHSLWFNSHICTWLLKKP